jgi:hypothetical protein
LSNPAAYCASAFGSRSYCTSGVDKCGRSVCHGGGFSGLTPCSKLLL